MGGRVPGPVGMHMRQPDEGGDLIGTLRNLQKYVRAIGSAATVALDFLRGGENVRRILNDIYGSPGGSSEDPGNATDLVSDRLPPGRDSRPPPMRTGGGIKNLSASIRLKDTKLLPDFRTLTLFGEAKATVEIPTEYPPDFDAPTEIALKVTSTSISPKQIGVVGRATMYKVFHGDIKLQLHYDSQQLIETIARFAKQRNLTRAEVEQLLRSISFDASTVLKAGLLPVSFIKVSAASLLPMRRPLIGATDELLPVQIASLPGREMFVGGAQVVPKGVFFDTFVPALGLHYSKYGRTQGVAGTIAGLAKPDLEHLGQVQAFGYVDLHYAKRVSDAVDLDVGITYTYSPSHAAGESEALQLQYLHARSKSWLPRSQDNDPPGDDRSGHRFMFTLKGTFDML